MERVIPIPAFNDNYIWCVVDPEQQRAIVVDPGDAAPVVEFLEQNGLKLEAILITHHHGDHVGGVKKLLQYRSVPVYGPATTPFPGITQALSEGDQAQVMDLDFQVIEVPGHTLDHIAYYAPEGLPWPALFCGDTLFACGCGRLFEGSAEQMQRSLAKLAALPDATRVFCAHEYTLANLRFSRAVLPQDEQLQAFENQCQSDREAGRPTLPVTLGNEKLLNPFLRWGDNAVISAAMDYAGREGLEISPETPASVFAVVRRWKDKF